jgi:hypothetical protein
MNRGLRQHLTHTAALLFCVAGVPVVVIGLVWWSYGVPLSAFRPFINDEVYYWHQAATFAAAGFEGGYYTHGELTNPSGVTPFGPHGPGFPVLYGTIGWLFGWLPHRIVAVNLVAVAAAAWACAAMARLGAARTAALGLLLVTFWPLVLWAPTGMQESLHHAGAILMAGCVAAALGGGSRLAIAAGWVVLSGLGFVRPSWLVLMPVWALAVTWRSPLRSKALAFTAGGLVSLAILVAYGRTAAPFIPAFFFLRVASAGVGVRIVADNVLANLRMAADLGSYEPLEVLHRLQYWLWLATASVLSLLAFLRRVRRGTLSAFAKAPADDSGVPDAVPAAAPWLLAGAAAMASALAFMLLLYTFTNAAEQRVLSAFLLFAASLAVCAPGRVGVALAAVLVASNVATAGLFVQAFRQERQDNFVWDTRGNRELASALAGRVVFHPGEPRWCNTLLTSQFPPFLAVLPPGIGISIVREPNQMALPPKSKYLLIDDRAMDDFSAALRLQPLARLPYGTLSLNLDAMCP